MRNALNNYDSFFYKTIALSATVHLLFVFVFIYGKLLPSKTINYNPVYTVKLVSMMPQTGEAPGIPQTAGAKKAVQSVTQKPASRMVMPVEKKMSGKRAVLSALRQVSSEIKQQQLLSAIQEAAKGQGSSGTKKAESAAGSSTGIPSGAAAQQYYSLLWQKIQDAWLIPSNMADASYGYETVVSITIHKDGTVTGISVEKSSGNIYFDQTAIRAIKKAAPLPPFPPSWLQQSIDIGLKFSCKEGCK